MYFSISLFVEKLFKSKIDFQIAITLKPKVVTSKNRVILYKGTEIYHLESQSLFPVTDTNSIL